MNKILEERKQPHWIIPTVDLKALKFDSSLSYNFFPLKFNLMLSIDPMIVISYIFVLKKFNLTVSIGPMR